MNESLALLLGGLTAISLGVFLLWSTVVTIFSNLLCANLLRDENKYKTASFDVPWYMHWPPFVLIPLGVVLLVLR